MEKDKQHIALKDGTVVHIRMLKPEDREVLKEAFSKLSQETKRLRFLEQHDVLSEKELDYLLNVDNHNHVAFCAYVIRDGKEVGVGVARYIRSLKNQKLAEVAITIVDEFQGKGIGKYLIGATVNYARENGITTFAANAFYFNRKILRIIEKYQYHITSAEDGVLKIEIDITHNGY